MSALAIPVQEKNSTTRLSCMRSRRHSRQSDEAAVSYMNANNVVPRVLITPPPKNPTPPLLLLEGDEMFISRAGKSRTVYRLKETPPQGQGCGNIINPILEETYDIGRAQKRMSLLLGLGLGPPSKLQDDDNNIFSFNLQEIDHGVQNGSGTGSMSWDSGIVMGLYFAVNPDELRGDILELGSGVGLGGILSINVASSKSKSNIIPSSDDTTTTTTTTSASTVAKSVTLTDINDDVLNTLRHNIRASTESTSSRGTISNDNICIQKLDWFDFIGDFEQNPTFTSSSSSSSKSKGDANKKIPSYDTIIASDCAYLQSQVAPLSETITKLLGRCDEGKQQRNKLHMFAPYNRGVVYDLVDELHNKGVCVEVEDIELSKYRIREHVSNGIVSASVLGRYLNDNGADESCRDNDIMTCGVTKFLHITAWHKTGLEILKDARKAKDQMLDID